MSTKGVPFTATSTTALFGSRNLNGVQDIRITNKTTNYVNDGCGRDNYIKFPNGGFRHTWENNYRNSYNSKMSLNDYLKFTNINPKFSIYQSDGCGRDSYIIKNCGGFYQLRPGNYKQNYFGNLRNYNYDPFVNDNFNRKENDYMRYVRMYRTPKEIQASKDLSKKQRATSARLSKPKNIKSKK
jgi:hypothetical protein